MGRDDIYMFIGFNLGVKLTEYNKDLIGTLINIDKEKYIELNTFQDEFDFKDPFELTEIRLNEDLNISSDIPIKFQFNENYELFLGIEYYNLLTEKEDIEDYKDGKLNFKIINKYKEEIESLFEQFPKLSLVPFHITLVWV